MVAYFLHPTLTWGNGRGVDGTGLENRRCASIRGFESYFPRQRQKAPNFLETRKTEFFDFNLKNVLTKVPARDIINRL